jgi:Gram-negative bacterial TonB protein C-terminal
MSSQWVDGFARSLIQHAARTAPASLSERLEEEWLADFEQRRGALARLRFGVGCCWATRVIALEHFEPKVAAAGTTTGSKVMTAFAQPDYSFLSRRTTAFILIVGLHAVIIYGFATGLAHTVIERITKPVITSFVDIPKVIERPPELARRLMLTQPKVTVDVTPRKFDEDSNAPQDVTTIPGEYHAPPATLQQPSMVTRVSGGPGKSFPNTDDYYPPAEIRMGRKGIATVRVCTDDKGMLTAAPMLAETSGSAGLDQGALRLAQAGSGHYRATMEDGRPVSSCYPFRIRFDYKN